MDRLHGENQEWKIEGSKKGGGGGPTEEPDTLRSRGEAGILVALCEGEIEGFPTNNASNRGKYIYLDGTPLISSTGSANFNTGGDQDVSVQFATGTQSQSPLNGFNSVRIEQSLGTKVTRQGGRVSMTTTRSDLNRIIVRIGIGSLFKVEDDGDIKADNVRFNIKIFDFIGSNPIVDQDQEISGKSRGPFDRDYFFALSGTGPWTVRVRRITADPDDLKKNNDLYFKAIVGILDDRLSYPNTAMLGMKFSAESFTSVPRVSVEIKGIKIRVPTGVSSSGVWGGAFTYEYSNNPAWVLYDLMTNERYGAGLYIEADDIDIYSLYQIAQYCDERVSDGKGGTEKRFTFNGIINNRAEAYEVMNGIAAVFRGMIYFAQGVIMATQDRPGNVVRQFSPANVVVEVDDRGEVTRPPFSYEGTALKARKTAALVSWNDRDDMFKSKVEYVEDAPAIQRYKYRETEIRAFGCTKIGQARRIGYWTLLTNLNETETVTFKVSAEGFFLMPGEIIEIADPYKSAGVAAGTLAEGGTTGLVLDRAVTLADGVSYEIIIRDGSNELRAAVTNSAGSTSNISVSPAFTTAPEPGSPWLIRESSTEAKKYRIIGLTEDAGLVTVLATEYYEAKYDMVDNLQIVSPQLSSVATSNLVGLPQVNPSSMSFSGL